MKVLVLKTLVAVPSIIGFGLSLMVGTFLLAKDHRNLANRLFFVTSFLISMWFFITYESITTEMVEEALFYQKLLFFWPLIFTFFAGTIVHLFPVHRERRRTLRALFIYISLPSILFIIYDILNPPTADQLIFKNNQWQLNTPFTFVEVLASVWGFSLILLSFIYLAWQTDKIPNQSHVVQKRILLGSVGTMVVGILDSSILPILNINIPLSINHFLLLAYILIACGFMTGKMTSLSPTMTVEDITSLMTNLLFLVDEQGLIREVNPATVLLLGKKRESIIGAPLNAFVTVPNTNDAYLKLSSSIGQEVEVDVMSDGEEQQKKTIPVLMASSRILDSNGKPIGTLFIGTSLEELKKAWKEVQTKEWLVEVGRLAGGIAHDLNNILIAITGYTELILDEDNPLSKELAQSVRRINTQGYRASTLIRKLMDYSQQSRIQPETLDLVAFLNDYLETSKPMLEMLSVTFISTLEQAWVSADEAQLQQIVQNIVNNARDALVEKMEKDKKFSPHIRIKMHKPVDKDFSNLFQNIPRNNRWLCISIEDNGPGIPEDIQPKVFNPLFTTKERSEESGLGLGLAQAQGLVRLQGGHITLKSDEGRGTTFYVLLPEASPPEKKQTKGKRVISKGQGQLILVVDDNEDLLFIAKKALVKTGYQVLTSLTVSGGRQLIEEHVNDVKLVILDMILTDGEGTELVQLLRERGSKTQVMILTGFDKVNSTNKIVDGVDLWVQKPVKVADLLSYVQNLLHNK